MLATPATPGGVYPDKGGQWYCKVTLARDADGLASPMAAAR
jgi:hypothetical protein